MAKTVQSYNGSSKARPCTEADMIVSTQTMTQEHCSSPVRLFLSSNNHILICNEIISCPGNGRLDQLHHQLGAYIFPDYARPVWRGEPHVPVSESLTDRNAAR